MATAKVDGLTLGYEVIGGDGQPWVITPGGRFTKEEPGIRELAEALASLLRHLGMAPAVIMGGSGGARVSLLTAANHPDVAAGLAVVWISGGVFGLMSLGVHYCAGSIKAAWTDGMAAVAALPEWAEVTERNPANRQRFLDQDR